MEHHILAIKTHIVVLGGPRGAKLLILKFLGLVPECARMRRVVQSLSTVYTHQSYTYCTWIVLLVHAVRSPDYDVVRPPRELLDVGTIVGEGDGTSEVSDAGRVNVRYRVEILGGGKIC